MPSRSSPLRNYSSVCLPGVSPPWTGRRDFYSSTLAPASVGRPTVDRRYSLLPAGRESRLLGLPLALLLGPAVPG
jgi:hypothetical protein